MKKNSFFVGMLVALMVLGVMVNSCHNGTTTTNGNDNGYGIYAELKESTRIKIYKANKSTDWSKITGDFFAPTGFTVTVGGAGQTIDEIGFFATFGNAFNLYLDNPVPGSGEIKVSYDGSGTCADKVHTFTNITVSRK
jgi:hypothetical protein